MTVDVRSPSARRKVLLVEDDPGVRRFIHLLLQSSECDIRAYADGSALLADATAIEADGLIADYRSPDIDGLTILGRLRDKGWHGPAILITGFASPQLLADAKARGFTEIFEKPIDTLRFEEAVERLFLCRGAS